MSLRFDALKPVRESEAAPLASYTARDGTRLPIRRYEGAGDPGVSLLLLHGSGSHSRYLAPLARRLAESGTAHVYTPDLRGHGYNPARRGDIDYIDQLEDDLADLMDHAAARRPGGRVFIGGHSSGGGLAVRFAGGRHGSRSAGFVLLAPFLGHAAPTTRRDSGGWARPRIPVIVSLGVLNGFGIEALNGVVAITFDMPEAARDGSETLAYSYRLNTGFAPRNFRTDLAKSSAPLLALIGAEDEAFYPESLPTALADFPTARVEIVPGAAHLDLPANVSTAERIASWLKER